MDKNIFGDTKILVFIFGLVVIVLKKTMAGFPTLFITPLKLTISRSNGPVKFVPKKHRTILSS